MTLHSQKQKQPDLFREWTEDGQLWVQYVSSTPATRLDVINLQEQLDHKLQQRQARETGICPIREELYAQCFGMYTLIWAWTFVLKLLSGGVPIFIVDELIRQVTINCAERGLLLLRVRDEIRMTIAAYQTLYESSIAFGMRKALMAEQRKVPTNNQHKLFIFYFLPFLLLLPIQAEMEAKIKHLESDKKDLERQVQDLMNRCDAIEKREQERRAADEKKHTEEVLVKNAQKRGIGILSTFNWLAVFSIEGGFLEEDQWATEVQPRVAAFHPKEMNFVCRRRHKSAC